MNKYALVGDIGGTNARFAMVPFLGTGTLKYDLCHVKKYACKEYASLTSMIHAYLESLEGYRQPHGGTIAVPCPVEGDRVRFTNIGWDFFIHDVQHETGIKNLSFVNDFYAQAYYVMNIKDRDVVQIGNGHPVKGKPVSVIGPGSGLGTSFVIQGSQGPVVVDSEGGHVTFSPTDDVEIEILQILKKKWGHVSNERLLSGQGIENIYFAMTKIHGHPHHFLTAREITDQGVKGKCHICSEVLDRFFAILGTYSGNMALSAAALGGVFLSGGIIPRFAEFISSSSFREKFESKGRFRSYMENIPTYVIISENPGLYGAANVFYSMKKA